MNYTIEHPLDYIASRDFNPELIANSTSKLCRFTGRCRFFYSVAHHMNLAAHLAGRLMNRHFDAQKKKMDESEWFAGAHKRALQFFRVVMMAQIHDSLECNIGDIITPVKHKLMFDPCAVNSRFAKYRNLMQWENEKLLETYQFHNIDPTLFELDLVAQSDKYALSYEVMALMDSDHPCWQSHLTAYPISTFGPIAIARNSHGYDEEEWLTNYYEAKKNLTIREAMII